MGTSPEELAASALAPFRSSSSTISARPRNAAACKAVPPSLFRAETTAPRSINVSAAACWPTKAAQVNKVTPKTGWRSVITPGAWRCRPSAAVSPSRIAAQISVEAVSTAA